MTLKKSDILQFSQKLSGSFQELCTIRKKKKNKDEAPARSWIEATFHKRECVRFIAHTQHTKDEQR
ncbi:hypothetical protein TcasGA2_TC033761 [Tribolium castaneum]|uniref:Uncharacterized protein n=2 Tax=Tribolium castaneum TaxID=7070 RepID=A0A139WF02_TRICA|nr:hypothetical protein TcasGA2_TC033761 [Tribolium castaneum]